MKTSDVIKRTKIIAIARGIYGQSLISASRALYDGGIRAFEVTFEQDKPIEQTVRAIEDLASSLPGDCVIGAGTVMNSEQTEAAYNAGASFIISPNTSKEVITKTKELSMTSVPGAMTPTEIAYAWSCGADIVKLFPAGNLGTEYFKAIKAPFKHIPIAAVAGITVGNIRSFSDAGAVAFGISSSLYLKDSINRQDFDPVRLAAERFFKALLD